MQQVEFVPERSIIHIFFNDVIVNNLKFFRLKKVKPVGNEVKQSFVPLTEIPPPSVHRGHGRRHMEQDCTKQPEWQEVHGGPRIEIIGDYYEEDHAKTVATVVIPDHIDCKF